MRSTCFLLAALLSAPALSAGKDSNILVHIPFALHNPDGFDHEKAQFGFDAVSRSTSLAEYVYYIAETLCAPVTNQTAGFPAHDAWRAPYILLINGGGVCSEVTKVRHAQTMGAAAVLLAEPHCLCSDTICTSANPTATCDEAFPLLVNDGSGADISIPSFVIAKSLGDALKEQLRKDQPCLVELQWGIRNHNLTSARPEIHFWSSAYDPLVSLETYVDLRSVVTAFDDVVQFSPRYALIDGSRFKCQGEPDANAPCDHLCTNKGRYCTTHAKDLSGNAIVTETLRRLCVWKLFSATAAGKYWDYVIYHKQECGSPHLFADQACIDDALQAAKIDGKLVAQCMDDAGNVDKDATNALLDLALTEQSKSGVVALPALSVQHKVLRYTSARSLFDTVCTEYWLSGVDKIPAICETCGACPNTIGCLEQGKCVDFSNKERHPDTGFSRKKHDGKKKKGHGWKIFFSFVFVAGAAAAAYYYYEHYVRGNRRGGVSLMNDYLHLSGED